MKKFSKTFKSGPFEFPKLGKEHPLYGTLLAREIRNLDLLPDFSEDDGIFILSDFGGEHREASFQTYSFLFCSADKRSLFENRTKEIREKYKLNTPWKELSYKDLRYGPIKRALSEILDAADALIHGLLLTISIDKNIQSMFGQNKTDGHSKIIELLKTNGLGQWKGNEAEKLLRICHPIGILLSVMGDDGKKIFWMCDHDSINAEGKERDFSHTQKVLFQASKMYSDNEYKIFGFAKPFNKDHGTSDLLSLTDFSAGAIQELLQSEITGKDINVTIEKEKIMKWMGTKSKFLKKANIVFTKKDDETWGVGPVTITAKI
ncbi:hypothetical protein LCGC14_1140730 [marine sediment metagenome]|uniref:DUF3800 domain-containing protein n=1 Tax=marine sediment metagenome TaxID=412755 RepID=A0A0F9PGI9_9ZZZZ